MARIIEVAGLRCALAANPAPRVVYVLYPMDNLRGHLDAAAERCGFNIVALSGMDWDNDLTPWPAAGVPAGDPPFRGFAPRFLETLRTQVLPQAEAALGLPAGVRRDLVGVSLSGLFAMWQWTQCALFRDVASLSGSFWYDGFVDWFDRTMPHNKGGRALLMLGVQEGRSNVPEFRSIPSETLRMAGILRSRGIATTFLSVPGNHYQHAQARLEAAFDWLRH